MDFFSAYTSWIGFLFTDILVPILVFLIVLVAGAFMAAAVVVFINDSMKVLTRAAIVGAILAAPVAINATIGIYDINQKRNAESNAALMNPEIVGQSHIDRYIVVGRNPPKHFYVTLKSVETGGVYETLYVSKHCNNHYQIKDGDEVNVRVHEVWRQNTPDQKLVVFENLYQVFCE